MELVKDLGVLDVGTKQPIRFGIYKCRVCGKEFKARTANIKSGNTKSCGCNKYPTPNKYKFTSMYSSWDHMKQRCLTKTNDNYHRYGGRGITVCNNWLNFDTFSEWASQNGWKQGLSIDRIDNNGNYKPSNCRWTDQFTQSQNTRVLQINNTSGYRGVSKAGRKWKAEIMWNRTMYRLGHYSTPLEAAKAYDSFVLINHTEHTPNNVELFNQVKLDHNG